MSHLLFSLGFGHMYFSRDKIAQNVNADEAAVLGEGGLPLHPSFFSFFLSIYLFLTIK